MKTKTFPLTSVLLCLAAFISHPIHATLPGMKVTKLFSKGQTNYGNRQFGAAVAINETYAVVGEPAFNLASPAAGAVHVFNAATGAFIRVLKPTTSFNNDGFGSSLALNGKLLLIGADGHNSVKGGCFLFDLSTGRQLRQFEGLVVGDRFGQTVAMNDELLFMAAPGYNNNRGQVRVEGITTSFSATISDSGGNSNDQFGTSIYTYGKRVAIGTLVGKLLLYKGTSIAGTISGPAGVGFGQVLVGNGYDIYPSAPFDDTFANDAGALRHLSFINNTPQLMSIGDNPFASRKLGQMMALDRNLLVTSFDAGFGGVSLLLHDFASASDLLTIYPQDLGTSKPASAIALSSGRLLVGSTSEATQGMDAGAAYLIQTFAQPETFATLAVKSGPAPGYAGLTYNSLSDAVANDVGYTTMRSTLSGLGSNGNRDSGLYLEGGGSFGLFDSVVKSRETYSGSLKFGTVGSPIANYSTYCVFPSTLTGPGITAANNTVLLADSGSAVTTLARAGNALFPVPQFTVASIRQAAQSNSANRVAVRLDAKIVAGGTTTALNDSTIALQNYSGVNAELVREDADIGMGFKVGQIAPRVAFHSDVYLFSAAIRQAGNSTYKEVGVLKKTPMGALDFVALSGLTVPGAPDFKYTGFIGEGGSSANMCLRTIVKGPGITAAKNEVILFDRGTGLTTVLQKGGSIISRILRVWPMGDRLLAQVTLKGPGITVANNEALFLYQENGSFSKVLQKGNTLPNTGGLRIGTIQRVEIGLSGGYYGVLCSLSGAPTSKNQVLLRGSVSVGLATDVDEYSLRRPTAVLRKGQLFANGYAGSTRLTSLTFANNSTMDATGVGRKGLGCVVSTSGSVLMRATFSDGSTRLIRVP